MDVLAFSNPESNIVSDLMFGAKFERGSGPEHPRRYSEPMDFLSVSSLRIGYDVDLGAFDTQVERISTFESIQHAASEGRPVVLVLVTKNLFLADRDENPFTPRELNTRKIDKIADFIKDLLTSSGDMAAIDPRTIIDAIELGNEYWGLGEMTSLEYGKLVNVLARSVQDAINEAGVRAGAEPKILVQMGSTFSLEFESDQVLSPYADLSFDEAVKQANEDIISQITDPMSKRAIDGLVEHYYGLNTENGFEFTSEQLRNINSDWSYWEDHGYGQKDLYITEWNNKLSNPSQYGLKGAGVMIEMFENMVRMGVDSAVVWPFQHNATRLVDTLSLGSDGLPLLTPRGAAFKLMAESLVGTSRLESNLTTENGYDYELNAYSSDDEFVFFISSRIAGAQSINLDLSKMVTDPSQIEGVKVGIDKTTADGTFWIENVEYNVPLYQDPDALAKITDMQGLSDLGNLSFNLGAFEFVRLVVTVHEGTERIGSNLSDRLVGAEGRDTIYGNNGMDTLVGQLADDIIDGGSGIDRAVAGAGGDIVRGGTGSDVLKGQGGADEVLGGGGDDVIEGGYQGDLLIGDQGQDTLYGSFGSDTLTGGSEGDVFIFDTGASPGNADIITDFNAAEDTIILNSDAFIGISKGDLGRFSMTSNSSDVASDEADQIFYDTDSGKLYFSTDSEGFSNSVHFLTLSPALSLSDLNISII